MNLRSRVMQLEKRAASCYPRRTIPESLNDLLAYLAKSGYSFAAALAEMLLQDGDGYALAVCRGLLLAPDPEQVWFSLDKIYGEM